MSWPPYGRIVTVASHLVLCRTSSSDTVRTSVPSSSVSGRPCSGPTLFFSMCFRPEFEQLKVKPPFLHPSKVLIRNISILAWVYPWVEWSFSAIPDSAEVVSKTLDIYGYTNFCSPLFAAIPGVIFTASEKLTRSKLKGEVIGLVFAMIRFQSIS